MSGHSNESNVLFQVLALSGITSSISKVVFHSEDPNIFMTIEQRCWTCFVYCPVTARGPEVQQIHSITPPVSYQPLLLAYGVVVCQLDNGQVSRHNIDAVQLHDPDADDYDAEAHTRCALDSENDVACLEKATGVRLLHSCRLTFPGKVVNCK